MMYDSCGVGVECRCTSPPLKKCCFLSGHCSWAINEMTSGQCDGVGGGVNGRAEEEQGVGGCLFFACLQQNLNPPATTSL